METPDLLFVFLCLGLVQGLFLIVALLLLKDKNRIAVYSLVTLVICFSTLIGLQIASYYQPERLMVQLLKFGSSIPLLIGPLLYLYISSIIKRSFSWNRRSVIHFLPFALAISLPLFPAISHFPLLGFFTIAKGLHTFIYLLFCVKLLSARYHDKKEWFNRKLLRWLVWIQISTFLLIQLFVVGEKFLAFSTIESDLISSTIFIFFFFGFVLVIILHPNTTIPNKNPIGANAISTLSDSKINTIRGNLVALLEEEKLYLDPDLSLTSLSEKMHVNVHDLSRVINQALEKNFNQLINEYRVQEVKRNILDERKSLLGIALDSGFKSKSAFNRIFKDQEGLTPSDYKKSIQKMRPNS